MAKTQVKGNTTSPIGGGWAGATLRTLLSIFTISIVFGVFLLAVVVTNTTLNSSVPYYGSNATSVSGNAVNFNGLATPASNTLTLTLSGTLTGISPSSPLTLAVTGNAVQQTFNGLNGNAKPTTGTAITQVFTITSSTSPQTLSSTTGNFYNITSITLKGAGPAEPNLVASVAETFNTFNPGTTNTITGVGTLTVSQSAIGSTGQTPGSVYSTLVGYLVTLANFVGIIILLVVIMLVILVIYALFAPVGGGFGGSAGGI